MTALSLYSILLHMKDTRQATMEQIHFRRATEADIAVVFALYRSLVGTPYCAWTADYPAFEHVVTDVAHGALYVAQQSTGLIAAGTIDHLEEHDPLQAWAGQRPCDLLRFGVARNHQGQGIGTGFLRYLCREAALQKYDALRILVSSTNFPAIALYRKIGAIERGDAHAYAIHWLCFEYALHTV